MNAKIFFGNFLVKIGLIKLNLKILSKFGYYFKYNDHECNGVDIARDIKADSEIENIKVVFDVGASIGRMTELFQSIFYNSQIHSFEPYRKSFEALQLRFKFNDRIILNNFALADKEGEDNMYIQKDSGYNSLSENINLPDKDMQEVYENISISTIDNYCMLNNIQRIDFLKIDTEGFDINVLKGALKLIENRMVKYIFVECTFHKDNNRNTQFIDLINFLEPFGYKVRSVFDQSNWGDKSYLTCVNILFLLQEKDK